ncbi:hypothetical protein N473_01085 [Pseudoalteromonas luteoviolacea CPMOR-1]|uniref:Uncharacterized protein n=1 Tax=Pseudoalteromonas luteoviolacea CPMOR-1 TaxID=1365248 RepID=A0A167LTS0_9GAMM|nr:hypothetical protein N473_01085 [Pseudoalteromonas luteoviolacea CPMOR-1]
MYLQAMGFITGQSSHSPPNDKNKCNFGLSSFYETKASRLISKAQATFY